MDENPPPILDIGKDTNTQTQGYLNYIEAATINPAHVTAMLIGL